MKTQSIIKNALGVGLLLVSTGLVAQQPAIQNFRQPNANGLNVFETPKDTETEYEGLKVRVGGAFTQQYQALDHSNNADIVLADPGDPNSENLNQLYDLAPGFNLATANLNFDVQLARGIRLNMVTYLSARHHPEAWVKGGYIQVDALPFSGDNSWYDDYLTLRVGHMEVNYGDQHFRRSDNGMALYNPFVGNTIMDAFATEIGGDLTFQHPSGFLAMVGMTNGEIQGNVSDNDLRGAAIMAKVGYDKQLDDMTRVRLTASVYNAQSSRNTLYAGDRAGSRFYYVMENTSARASSDFRSARFNPNITNDLTSIMINPFVKFGGLEVFGLYEMTSGTNDGETEARAYTQMMGEVLYRFLDREQVYVGGQYNVVNGPVAGADVTITRIQAGAGWFITDNILLKANYVAQNYDGYASTSILHEGSFNGVIAEAVVSF